MVEDLMQDDHDVGHIRAGRLSGRFVACANLTRHQRGTVVRQRIRAQLAVLRFVAVRASRLVATALTLQLATNVLIEVALHLQDEAADFPRPVIDSASAMKRA